ncbi:MAG: TonB-dependent receptor [Chitinophagaceae bacterium]
MKKRLQPFFVSAVTAILFSISVFAQQSIRGTLRTATGEPLSGATITLKGTNKSVTTDEKGQFTIDAPIGSVLVASYIGYANQETDVTNQSELNIQLQGSFAQDLQQVVVVGYGTQQKKDLTGAVSVVKPSEIQKRQATTVAEALQGLASGVYVRGGGRPGSEASIQIRGIKNLSNSNPLYVIDGMITTANRDFNPNDIESIQILKDASAAAIYGSRAANGVIIITTKKGRQGPMKVEFSGKASLQVTPRYELADTEEFSRINFMAYDNASKPRQSLDLNNNTDWQDAAFQVGNMQDYNLSFSGGSANGSYLVSGGYFGNKGTVISTQFDRLSFRVNTQGSKGIFSIGENLAITNSKSNEMSGNPYADVVRLLPTIPVNNAANPGGYGYGNESKARTFGTNPVAIANLEDRTNENFRIRGNLWSELKFFPFLKYRLNLGYETSAEHYDYLRKQGNWTLNQPFDPAIAEENRARWQSGLVENTLSFNKTFGNHSINAVVGQTYQRDDYSRIHGRKRNIIRNSNGEYIDVLDQGNEPQTGGFKQRAVLLSYLGRVEYNFSDKYLFNAVFRRDGTSRLSAANQWGNFPSVSAAWRISRESFFNVPWLNDLKLRASYGTLGSSNISYWDYLATINTFSTIAIGADQHIEPGATVVRLVNNNLKWERLTQKNLGLDAAFLNNKLSITAEYFISDTKDVLTGMPIAITTGNDGGNPVVNAASLRNKGFELSVTYREDRMPFSYYATANVTSLNNKVLELGYGRNNIYVGNTVTEIGQPIGMWYVLETDGLFQNQAEIDNYKNKENKVIQPTAKPGDIRFKDNNGDGQITNADKAVVGSPWSDVELGLNLGATYKNFELTMNWFGAFGATVYNGMKSLVDRFDDNSNYRKGVQPWTPQNPNTDVPRALYASTLNARGDTERFLEDGSFMRLKYIGIAYTLPSVILKRVGFSNAQISLSGQNVITLTKYEGLDPEFNNSSIYERGFDNFAFPNLKVYSLGLQLGF